MKIQRVLENNTNPFTCSKSDGTESIIVPSENLKGQGKVSLLNFEYLHLKWPYIIIYLTIILGARVSYGSIAHEAEGQLGYWLRGHEGERNNFFSKIQLLGQKYQGKTTLASKTRFSRHCFGFQSRRFSLLVNYNI